MHVNVIDLLLARALASGSSATRYVSSASLTSRLNVRSDDTTLVLTPIPVRCIAHIVAPDIYCIAPLSLVMGRLINRYD